MSDVSTQCQRRQHSTPVKAKVQEVEADDREALTGNGNDPDYEPDISHISEHDEW
jgi:hypothetical protein